MAILGKPFGVGSENSAGEKRMTAVDVGLRTMTPNR